MASDALFHSPVDALNFLRRKKSVLLSTGAEASDVMHGRDHVLEVYGPVFRSPRSLLTPEILGRFLSFSENSHWTGLDRQRPKILGNFDQAQRSIASLVDRASQTVEVASVFEEALQRVDGFGPGILSPILFVAYPDRFGVWNAKSEFALDKLGLGIVVDRGDNRGRKYEKFNAALVSVRNTLNRETPPGEHPIDLWVLDYYWHAIKLLDDSGELQQLATV